MSLHKQFPSAVFRNSSQPTSASGISIDGQGDGTIANSLLPTITWQRAANDPGIGNPSAANRFTYTVAIYSDSALLNSIQLDSATGIDGTSYTVNPAGSKDYLDISYSPKYVTVTTNNENGTTTSNPVSFYVTVQSAGSVVIDLDTDVSAMYIASDYTGSAAGNGNGVGSIDDLSSTNHLITQPTDTLRPILNIANPKFKGHNYVDFDGGRYFSLNQQVVLIGNFHVYAVLACPNYSVTSRYLTGISSSANGSTSLASSSINFSLVSASLGNQNTTITGNTLPVDEAFVLEVYRDGNTNLLTAQINGEIYGTASGSATNNRLVFDQIARRSATASSNLRINKFIASSANQNGTAAQTAILEYLFQFAGLEHNGAGGWYISANAETVGANGSQTNPFNMPDFLTYSQAAVQPGHTVKLLADGMHELLTSTPLALSGSTGNEIIVEPAIAGERPVLDNVAGSSFWGNDVKIYDLEITSTGTARSVETGAPHVPYEGLDIYTTRLTMTNIHFHDLGQVARWSATSGEMIGCIIRTTGRDAEDRGHGHNDYEQSVAGLLHEWKMCILVGGFANVIQIYGSSSASMIGVHWYNSIIIHKPLIVGGSDNTDDISFDNCVIFTNPALGYRDKQHKNISLTNSVLYNLTVRKYWQMVTVQNCIIIYRPLLFARIVQVADAADTTWTTWAQNLNFDNNIYINSAGGEFQFPGNGHATFAQWQSASGQDAHSVYYATAADAIAAGAVGPQIIKYYYVGQRKHFANVVVWSLQGQTSVTLDFSNMEILGGGTMTLPNGEYKLIQVRDYPDVYSGGDERTFTWNGSPYTTTLTGTAKAPYGSWDPVYHPDEIVPYTTECVAFELWEV